MLGALWHPDTHVASLPNPGNGVAVKSHRLPLSDEGRIRGPASAGPSFRLPLSPAACRSLPIPRILQAVLMVNLPHQRQKLNLTPHHQSKKHRGHTFKITPPLPPLNLHHHPTPTATLPFLLLIVLLPIPLPLPHSSRNLGPHPSPTLLDQPMPLLHVSN